MARQGTAQNDRHQAAHIGDVVTAVTARNFTSLAWDARDGALVGIASPGAGYGATPVVLQGAVSLAMPAQATSVAFDPANQTFYFAFGADVYSSVVGGKKLRTVTQSVGQAGAIALDADGNLYIVDKDHIDRLHHGKLALFTVPGSVTQGPGSFSVGLPSLAFDDRDGALYLTDTFSDTIKRILPGGKISLLAGHCAPGATSSERGCQSGGIPGRGARALFGTLSGIVYDPVHDDFIVADPQQNQLWRVTPSGYATVAAGYGPGAEYDGNALRAFFTQPVALTLAQSIGAIFVADQTRVATFATAGLAAPPFDPPSLRLTFADPSLFESGPALDGNSIWLLYGGDVVHQFADGTRTRKHLPKDDIIQGPIAHDAAGNTWIAFLFGRGGGPSCGLFRLDAAGKFTRIAAYSKSAGCQITAVTIGPDGNPWFGVSSFPDEYVETIAGDTVTSYATPRSGGLRERITPVGILDGPGGTIWYSASNSTIVELSTAGKTLSTIRLKESVSKMAFDRVSGDVWMLGGGPVYRRTPDGKIRGFRLPGPATDLTVDPSDTAWVAINHSATSIASTGKETQYFLPSATVSSSGVVAAGVAQIWYTDYFGQIFLFDPAIYARDAFPHAPSD
jgi:hypothetical protein